MSAPAPPPRQGGSPALWILAAIAGTVVTIGVVIVIVLLVTSGGDSPAPPEGELSLDSIPEGSVAFVANAPDGAVTDADLAAALERAALAQGLEDVPEPADGAYRGVREGAMGDLLLTRWIRGEGAERGIVLSEAEVEGRVDTVVEESFADEAEFEEFATEQGYCSEAELEAAGPRECEGVLVQAEVLLLTERIEEAVLGEAPGETGGTGATGQSGVTAEFQEEFFERWRARTICAEEVVTERCSNGPEPTDPTGVPPAEPVPGAPVSP